MRHEVRFPRHDEDIRTQKRTLFHMPRRCLFAPGDTLLLCAAPPSGSWVAVATITRVDQVKLCDLSADDLRLLNRDDAAAYFASWDALHPELPSNDSLLVDRIEFRYGQPEDDGSPSPEWCLAT